MQSAASSPSGSPVLLPTLVVDQHEVTDNKFFLCDQAGRGRGVYSHDNRKPDDGKQGVLNTGEVDEPGVADTHDHLASGGETERGGSGTQCGQVLQVHVETVDWYHKLRTRLYYRWSIRTCMHQSRRLPNVSLTSVWTATRCNVIVRVNRADTLPLTPKLHLLHLYPISIPILLLLH
jgi:hypothetical protein